MRKCSGVLLILTLAVVLLLSPSPSPVPPPTTAATGPVAHLLPSLPGLSDLYPPPANSTAQLSWALLRPLLRRSDALPGTAAGVLEAADAWRNLTLAVADAAAAGEEGRTGGPSCPASVEGDLGAGRARIPCGLAEGAAVTVIGVPREGAARFQVEMVGAGGQVLMHVNVSLGAAGMVVEQNSWTPEEGWGVYLRYIWKGGPGASGRVLPPMTGRSRVRIAVSSHWTGEVSAGTDKRKFLFAICLTSLVVGLVLCNEKVGASIIQENNNTMVNVTGNQPEDGQRPKERRQLSGSFSIVEGEPFTVTVWAGVEGFHMTLNGRHETSFAYRERSEPWLIAEVKVSGDLELLSFLANGLPVSEEIDMASVALLKAPPLPKKRTFLMVGVFSTGNNFKRRMALRRTWMQYEAVRSGDVVVRFFSGLTKIVPAKYMKTDDDAFVRIDEVISSLKKSNSHGLLYGLISFQSSPHRDKDSKWFISRKEWPFDMYPPWAHGPGYIISRDIAKFVVLGHQELTLQLFKLEDVAMGIWIQQYKSSGQQVNIVTDDQFYSEGCESDYVLAHYQTPRLMMCLGESLRRIIKLYAVNSICINICK
ncbi:putative beta-1,3-galactosyltransferase 16 [Panicum miliaceum]|uniref:Beta-1,3-galactosyltransferase 16 n=1 Tax=Panicum miliaceum TaxID=4540 RepID=A0A3L6QXD7_PANMI|nr:putative beta-1,3-galactosyltransferase 16 [Panicum miliaceum]